MRSSAIAQIPKMLTIAGSDSGGGAGIQADLKTFAALKTYGMSAITALTAQNTAGVRSVHEAPPAFVAAQIDAVAEDIGIDAAKLGMLSSAPIVEAVAAAVQRHGIQTLVVDPVMVAKSGDVLLSADAQRVLAERILPLALIVTPNIPEAEVLSGIRIADETGVQEAARKIHALGPRYVLIKGGHQDSAEAADCLYDGEQCAWLSTRRIDTPNTHGTGCTYSAAIAACLGHGLGMRDAIARAKAFLTEAIRTSLPLGQGHGPLNHLHTVRTGMRTDRREHHIELNEAEAMLLRQILERRRPELLQCMRSSRWPVTETQRDAILSTAAEEYQRLAGSTDTANKMRAAVIEVILSKLEA